MPKKVTFIITRLTNGGAERVMSIVANYFAQQDINVQIVALRDAQVDYPLDSRIKHIHIDQKFTKRLPSIIERIYKLRKIIRDTDIVISFLWYLNIYAIIASLFLNKKIIISDRSDPTNELNNISLFGKILRNLLYRKPNKIVFQTPDAKKYYSTVVQKKSVIIPNPISPNLPERYTGIKRKEIVAVCRIVTQKNLKMMINAYQLLVQEHSDYTLVIYGEGELKHEINEYIKELGLEDKVKLPGFKTDIHNRIIDSAMYVSSSNYEGISNSMIEALGIGLPSVVTDCPVGGARMFIENNENGILVSVGDVEAMYRGMKKIIENPEFGDRIGKNATQVKEKLKVDVICQEWLELL